MARVFGPQEGATPAQVEQLAAALDHGADLFGDVRAIPGGGASGGLGAGLHAVLNATLVPRFDVILEHSDLDARTPTSSSRRKALSMARRRTAKWRPRWRAGRRRTASP